METTLDMSIDRLGAISERLGLEKDEARLAHIDKALMLAELISVGAKHVTKDHDGDVSNCLGCAMTDTLKELNVLDEARNRADAGQTQEPQDAQARLAEQRARLALQRQQVGQ